MLKESWKYTGFVLKPAQYCCRRQLYLPLRQDVDCVFVFAAAFRATSSRPFANAVVLSAGALIILARADMAMASAWMMSLLETLGCLRASVSRPDMMAPTRADTTSTDTVSG